MERDLGTAVGAGIVKVGSGWGGGKGDMMEWGAVEACRTSVRKKLDITLMAHTHDSLFPCSYTLSYTQTHTCQSVNTHTYTHTLAYMHVHTHV